MKGWFIQTVKELGGDDTPLVGISRNASSHLKN